MAVGERQMSLEDAIEIIYWAVMHCPCNTTPEQDMALDRLKEYLRTGE